MRGTPLDVFGYTDERRTERALIGWYEAQIERILASLAPQHLGDLLKIAKAPMDIRGYGPVKEAAIHTVKAEVERLWERIAEATVDRGFAPTACRPRVTAVPWCHPRRPQAGKGIHSALRGEFPFPRFARRE